MFRSVLEKLPGNFTKAFYGATATAILFGLVFYANLPKEQVRPLKYVTAIAKAQIFQEERLRLILSAIQYNNTVSVAEAALYVWTTCFVTVFLCLALESIFLRRNAVSPFRQHVQ